MKILVAVEDAKFGEAMANFIAEHQWPDETEIKLIHALEPIPVNVLSGYPGDLIHNVNEERNRAARSLLLSIGSKIAVRLPKAPIYKEVIEGSPKEAILQMASDWDAELIVLGSHGRTGLSQFLLGSVSMSVLSAAPCSVMVVKLPKEVESPENAKEKKEPVKSGS